MAVGDQALADLRAHPLYWLQANALEVWGLSATGSGAEKFRLYKTDRTWQMAVEGAARDVTLWTMFSDRVRATKGDPSTASAPFDVHYVSMREFKNGYWEDANTTHYMLPANSGADMMVTSKLNGCTFGIGSNSNGGRLVSHLRPPNMGNAAQPTPDAAELQRGIEGGFTSRGQAIDYRVMSTGDYNGTVIGRRTGTKWEFYVQRYKALPTGHGLIDAVAELR
jgi:hypothetical protein